MLHDLNVYGPPTVQGTLLFWLTYMIRDRLFKAHPYYMGWWHHIWVSPYHIGTINPQPTLATHDDGIWAPLYLRNFVISAHSYDMGLCNSSPPMSDVMT